METGELKSLPQMWLHSVHSAQEHGSSDSCPFVDQGAQFALRPLQPAEEGLTRASRKEILEHLLQAVISNPIGGVDAQAPLETHRYPVGLSNTSLVVEYGGRRLLHIPLLLTDVVAAALPKNQASGYVVALATRPEAASFAQEGTRNSMSEGLTSPIQDVWIFAVDGNSWDLKRCLFDLGGRGALRWDLHECYEIVQRSLGEGGGGKVFLGQSVLAMNSNSLKASEEKIGKDVLSIRNVAVKILKPHKTQTEEHLIRCEIGFLARARGHPNINALYGVFCAEDHCKEGPESQAKTAGRKRNQVNWCIVMELCSKGDLFDYLSGTPLCKKEGFVLMRGLSSALDHLHSLRILHRDVKPDNILIDARSQPVLSDMGISANLDDAVGMAQILGTPGYAAPEVVTKKKYGEPADMFSAGVVYYYALSCHLPFTGADAYQIVARTAACEVRCPRRWFERASTPIVRLMKLFLSRNPANRPSARQCLEALSNLERADSTRRPDLRHHERGSMAFGLTSAVSPSLQEVDRPMARELASSAAGPSFHVMAGLRDAESSSPVAGPSIREMAEPETASVPPSAARPPATTPAVGVSSSAAVPYNQQNQQAPVPPPASLARPPRLPSRLPGRLKVSPEPVEQKQVADRPARSRPGSIKRALRSMQSEASRWVARVLPKPPRPAVEDQASTAASSLDPCSKQLDSEHRQGEAK